MTCNSCNSRGYNEIKIDPEDLKTQSNQCSKLSVFNWLSDIAPLSTGSDFVEVRFKNTRKSFYKNINKFRLRQGDIVAVEANPGHDIGIVSLTGELVLEQMRKHGTSIKSDDLKKIYRKAKQNDIDKWIEAMNLESKTMLRSRQISKDLKLNMKIGDVEYQGDKTKAIFYYIADDRVDFRELIKKLADEFKIRIEMRQIGARQEAGRIGGIGTCGRELCCTTWITNFISVTTGSARYQELSLNPQKLAGQCSKLKCCLNYELDVYLDAQTDFPNREIPLITSEGNAYHSKTDVFKGIMWYSFDKEQAVNLTPVPVERVKEILALNRKNQKVEKLLELGDDYIATPDYQSPVGEDSISRFDDKMKRSKRKKKRKKNRPENDQNIKI
ncbi:MAG: regulatory iron-sulfur-containing complex subunit RicT [Bacteroidota bacterium]